MHARPWLWLLLKHSPLLRAVGVLSRCEVKATSAQRLPGRCFLVVVEAATNQAPLM